MLTGTCVHVDSLSLFGCCVSISVCHSILLGHLRNRQGADLPGRTGPVHPPTTQPLLGEMDQHSTVLYWVRARGCLEFTVKNCGWVLNYTEKMQGSHQLEDHKNGGGGAGTCMEMVLTWDSTVCFSGSSPLILTHCSEWWNRCMAFSQTFVAVSDNIVGLRVS